MKSLKSQTFDVCALMALVLWDECSKTPETATIVEENRAGF